MTSRFQLMPKAGRIAWARLLGVACGWSADFEILPRTSWAAAAMAWFKRWGFGLVDILKAKHGVRPFLTVDPERQKE